MSLYTSMHREDHLDYVIYIFSYSKKHDNSRLVLDPTHPNINMDKFEKRNWKQFYGNLMESIPPHTPKPIGKEFIIRAFVDTDFA